MTNSPKDMTDALRRLMSEQSSPAPEPMATRGSAASSRSAAAPGGSGAKSGSDGIASPLTELDASLREYYSAAWKTTDGLFAFPALKKVVMTDANDASVVFIFAAPAP